MVKAGRAVAKRIVKLGALRATAERAERHELDQRCSRRLIAPSREFVHVCPKSPWRMLDGSFRLQRLRPSSSVAVAFATSNEPYEVAASSRSWNVHARLGACSTELSTIEFIAEESDELHNLAIIAEPRQRRTVMVGECARASLREFRHAGISNRSNVGPPTTGVQARGFVERCPSRADRIKSAST